MASLMFTNILTTTESRNLERNLEYSTNLKTWLQMEFGEEYDFRIMFTNDRVHFSTPEREITLDQRRRLMKEVPRFSQSMDEVPGFRDPPKRRPLERIELQYEDEDEDEDEDKEEEQEQTATSQEHRGFPPHNTIASSTETTQLLHAIQSCLLADDDAAEKSLVRYSHYERASKIQTWNVRICWELPDYLAKEKQMGQKLGDMIVATGDLYSAWHTQCRKYVDTTFGNLGSTFLDFLEMFGNRPELLKAAKSEGEQETLSEPPIGGFSVRPRQNSLLIKIRGTWQSAQRSLFCIAWFAATFRSWDPSLKSNDRPENAEVQMSRIKCRLTSPSSISMLLEPLTPSSADTCWYQVYRGVCTPQFESLHFPVHMKGCGAEMALDLMLALAGVQYPLVLDENVLILRGYETLLYPVGLDQKGQCIRWHILRWDDEEEVEEEEEIRSKEESYIDTARKQAIGLTAMISFDYDCNGNNWTKLREVLRTKRHFLGYSRMVNTAIGTAGFSTQDPDQRSGAIRERSKLLFNKQKVIVNLATSGLGIFGASAGFEFGLTESVSAKLDAASSFHRELRRSMKRPVLLYDVSRQTAYIVPELSIVLYITQSWFHCCEDLLENEITKLPEAERTSDGGAAALHCILSNQKTSLRRKAGEPWSFIDIIQATLNILKACRETTASDSTTAHSWLKLGKDSPRIYGWDIADVVADYETIDRQEAVLETNRRDLWISRLAHHRKTLTLFCKDIDPPIQVVNQAEMCARWNPVPPGRNYLLASSRVILNLIRYLRGNTSIRQLEDSAKCFLMPLRQHQPFLSCQDITGAHCRRLHTIVSTRPETSYSLPDDGAVLIGTSDSFQNRRCKGHVPNNAEDGVNASLGAQMNGNEILLNKE